MSFLPETQMDAGIFPTRGICIQAQANQFWNNKKAGIYVDVVSGEPLFSQK